MRPGGAAGELHTMVELAGPTEALVCSEKRPACPACRAQVMRRCFLLGLQREARRLPGLETASHAGAGSLWGPRQGERREEGEEKSGEKRGGQGRGEERRGEE